MTTALTDQYILELQIFRSRADAPAEYPFTIPAVRSLKRLKLHPKVTFFDDLVQGYFWKND